MITIRRATIDDIAELARLRWAMTDEMIGTTAEWAEFEKRFGAFARRALAGGSWAVFVAEGEGHLLGTVWVQLVERVPRPIEAAATYAYITSVYVAAEHRNVGLGRRTLDAAVAWIREQAIETVVLWPSERSVPFYERAGFTPSDALGLGR